MHSENLTGREYIVPNHHRSMFLLDLLLLHLGEDRERQELLVARCVGRRHFFCGERSQVTVHLRFELGLIRELVRQHLPRLFERLAEVEHLLKAAGRGRPSTPIS